jgi:hypothetical protein
MIGEISSMSCGTGWAGQHRESSGAAGTGTPRRPRLGGGSSSETNSPPTTSAITWVPIIDRAIALVFVGPAAPAADVR